jgi:tetratricopeptide (TPR) repeat protein
MSKSACIFVLSLFVSLLFFPQAAMSEKAVKKTMPQKPLVQKDAVISDVNIQAASKAAQEYLKAKDLDNAWRTYLKVYTYSKDVLPLIKHVHGQYEKAVGQSSTPIEAKEEILIKQKRAQQLISKYNRLLETSSYALGSIAAKKGDAERARKYLMETLDLTPFSTSPDSLWFKSKTLLLDLYQLEGEI